MAEQHPAPQPPSARTEAVRTEAVRTAAIHIEAFRTGAVRTEAVRTDDGFVGGVGVTRGEVDRAARRITGRVRPVAVAETESGAYGEARITLALEFLQHTGSFKARGAANLAAAHIEGGALPEAGVTIASGGNAGLACAWAARATGTRATVFVPSTAPAVKVARLRGYGARVRLVGTEYAHALEASIEYAGESGALLSHAYDNPLVAAGAGTLAVEILERAPDADTIVLAVGGGGLFAGVAAALAGSGRRVVAVEPERCPTLHAALDAGEPVDVRVEGVAGDSLGARRVSRDAYLLACGPLVQSVLVTDEAIVAARRHLWEERRVAVEHGAATALAALTSDAYKPPAGEHVVVVLCGANTDPADLG